MNREQTFQEMSDEVYNNFAQQMHAEYVVPNPICQVCNSSPSVAINRWGTIKACCVQCLEKELEAFNKYCEEQDKEDESTY